MKNAYQKRVLVLALFAGEIMMKNGAEISRVEDTIVRICKSCKIDYVECFVTMTGIFLSLDVDNEEADMHTFIKRINYTTTNLTKISQINQFSRVFTSTDLSVEDGFEQLKVINAGKEYHFLLRLLAAFLIGAFMVPPYGGTIPDMFCSAIASCAAFSMSAAIDILKFPPFIRIFISSAIAALIGFILVKTGIGTSITPVLLGAVTMFMPGVSITNAARDLLSGDMLSGVARVAQAIIVAVAIAGGIGVMMKVWLLSFGALPEWTKIVYPAPLFLLFGMIASIAFSILFRAPFKQFFAISIIGGIGMYVNIGGGILGYSAVATCFVGSCIMAILAEITSRIRKDASTLFILPGIIPFVPGNTLYQAMEKVLNGDLNAAATFGTEAFIISGSIALALVSVASVRRLVTALLRKIKTIKAQKKSVVTEEQNITDSTSAVDNVATTEAGNTSSIEAENDSKENTSE